MQFIYYEQSSLFAWSDGYHALISDAVQLEMAPYSLLSGASAFDQSLSGSTDAPKDHIMSRSTMAEEFLNRYRQSNGN